MKRLVVVLTLLASACGGGRDGGDLADELGELPGVHVYRVDPWSAGRVRVIADIEQPVDHDDPASPTFLQRVVIYHLNEGAPNVLGTQGYDIGDGTGIAEPTVLLEANEVQVEHRFFGTSRPTTVDWTTLSVAQAAADHHHVIEALSPHYRGPWVSTGTSKGGIAALAHRRFYPDDVRGTVAYVAPFSIGLRDTRYADYVTALGADTCGSELRAFQKAVLTEPRRGQLADALALQYRDWGLHYSVLGTDRIIELTTVETPFTFWQYGSTADCDTIPKVATATDNAVLAFIDRTNRFSLWSDEDINAEQAYWLAVATEQGYPADELTHLTALLRYDDRPIPLQMITAVLPPPAYDGGALQDIASWVASEASRLVLVYGGRDPWTAGAFTVSGNDDTSSHIVINGNHNARLQNLASEERDAIVARMQAWVAAP